MVSICMLSLDSLRAQVTSIFHHEYDLNGSGSGYHSGEGGADYKASDGSIYVSGVTDISGVDDDPLLIKTTSAGTLSFARQYRISDRDIITYGRLTSDGGYLMYGTMKGLNTAPDILLIKTDASGNVSWARRIEVDPFSATYLTTTRFDELASGGYVLTGQISGSGAGNGDMFMIKISSDGNTISIANAYGTANADMGYDILEHSSGNIAIVGDMNNGGGGTPFNAWWVEVTSTGTINYSKYIGGSNNESFRGLLETTSNTYMVLANWCSTSACSGTNICSGGLVHISTAGAQLMRKVFVTSSPGSYVFRPSCIYATPDNSSYWIGGMIDMNDHPIIGANNNAMFIKTSAATPSPTSGYSVGDLDMQDYSLSGGAVPSSNDMILGGTEDANMATEYNVSIIRAHSSSQCNSIDLTFTTCNWTSSSLTNIATTTTSLSTNLSTVSPTLVDRAGGTTTTQNCFSLLPVSLLSFEAKTQYQKILLSWTTASEQNNDHFILERSSDGIIYNSIAAISSSGFSSLPTDYTWIDSDYPQNVAALYYRLSQVDYDAKRTYLGTIAASVSVSNGLIHMAVPSNLITDGILQFNAASGRTGSLNVQLLDGSGRTVYSHSLLMEAGDSRWTRLDINHLTPGCYFLKVAGFGETQTKKVLLISGQ